MSHLYLQLLLKLLSFLGTCNMHGISADLCCFFSTGLGRSRVLGTGCPLCWFGCSRGLGHDEKRTWACMFLVNMHVRCVQLFIMRERDVNRKLGGGFKYFLFSPLFVEDFQFDYIIFFRWVETTNQERLRLKQK